MKDQLRYKYRIKRRYFQHSAREVADGAIKDVALAALADKQSFLVYHSFGSEADTHAVISALLALGKTVYLPRTEGDEMVAVRYNAGDGLKKSSFGIMEPAGEAFSGDADCALIPLLAVNGEGYRLGYGGGYYDRYLARHGNTLKVGIGYYFQLIDDKFQQEHDIKLDMFICERGIYYFGK